MKVLAMIQGEYGRRNVANIKANGPTSWFLDAWTAPRALPPVIDEPEEFVPPSLPPADLLLCFQEDSPGGPAHSRSRPPLGRPGRHCRDRQGRMASARAGKPAQPWFQDRNVPAVFPRPLCSLTEESYGLRGNACSYRSDLISEFARDFGRPRFEISCDGPAGSVRSVRVIRDSVCGCARSVAAQLPGVRVQDAVEAAGLAHHHHPCVASMGIDPDFNDTLMHVSGTLLKDAVRDALASPVTYVTPDGRIEAPP